jgi:hypothetical protein
MFTMKRPNRTERAANPFSYDVAETAKAMTQEGEQVLICVDVSEAAFREGKKPRIAEMLRAYGTVVDNADYSRLVVIKPHNVAAVKRLEDDLYEDKLCGVEALEVAVREVVYCSRIA